MLELTKLSGKKIYINPHLMETMDDGIDTRIYFVSGNSLVVKESQNEVIEKVIQYRISLGNISQES